MSAYDYEKLFALANVRPGVLRVGAEVVGRKEMFFDAPTTYDVAVRGHTFRVTRVDVRAYGFPAVDVMRDDGAKWSAWAAARFRLAAAAEEGYL